LMMSSRWMRFAVSALAVLLASVGAEAVRPVLGIVNISLVYLIVVVAVATVWGLWPALFASLLAALALDLLVVPPVGKLTVANPGDWLTILFFLAIAALTGRLAAGARARADDAQRRERAMAVLYDLGTALIGEDDLAVTLPAIARRAAGAFGLDACHILLPDTNDRLRVVAEFGPWDEVEGRGAQAIVRQVITSGHVATVYEPVSANGAYPRTPTIRRRVGAAWGALYLPLTVAGTVVGVMRVARAGGATPFDAEDERLLVTFTQQAALAIDKMRLSERARRQRAQTAALEEADRVKTALLSAVSHDLRSPLAAIKTAVTGLLEPGDALDARGHSELLEAIDVETDRLTRLVANLLDLSRLQGGALRPRKEWVDVSEIAAGVVDRLASRLPGRPITVDTPDDLPLIPADYARIDQVLSNLIENAAAYAPPATPIKVTVWAERAGISVRVRDQGPGISFTERERVFEPFYRGAATEGLASGSGLGLAICRGIVDAHGGSIRIEAVDGPGVSFAVWLPDAPPVAEDVARARELVPS